MIYNEEYTRKVLPFLRDVYFHDLTERMLFEEVKEYVEKYNKTPNVETLKIGIANKSNLTEEQVNSISEMLGVFIDQKDSKSNDDWLRDETEKFCQDKAIYNAVMDSIHILEPDGKKETRDRVEIPKILADALSVALNKRKGKVAHSDDDDDDEW